MARIIPFKAVRPTRDKVSFVCRSYEEYVTAELAAQLDFNPCLFACFKTCLDQESVSLKKGRQVNQKYQDFKAEKF
jgi:hypothetical protein